MELYIQHPILPLFVSNYGNVKKLNFSNKHTYVDRAGYEVLRFKKKRPNGTDQYFTHKVHRLVAELHLPEPTPELVHLCSIEHHGKVCVKHKDNNKTNNAAYNLVYDTSSGNTKDAWKDGLIPSLEGILNGRAVLTEGQVHELCKAFEEGMQPKEASELFNVSRQQASKIKAGIQWKHIWCQYNIKVNRRKPERSTTSRKT